MAVAVWCLICPLHFAAVGVSSAFHEGLKGRESENSSSSGPAPQRISFVLSSSRALFHSLSLPLSLTASPSRQQRFTRCCSAVLPGERDRARQARRKRQASAKATTRHDARQEKRRRACLSKHLYTCTPVLVINEPDTSCGLRAEAHPRCTLFGGAICRAMPAR